MNRIKTKEERVRKQKINQIILGVVMIVILVLSTVGFALLSNEDKPNSSLQEREVNGVNFLRQDNLWLGKINNKDHAFFYLPDEKQTNQHQLCYILTLQQYYD